MTCRACRDVLVALVLRSRRAARQARYSKSWLFLCRNSCARQSVVSWCDVPSGIWALAYKGRGCIVAAVFVSRPVPWIWLCSYRKLWHHPTTTSLVHRTTSDGSWNFGRGGERKTSPSSYITNAHKDMHIFYTGKRCLIEKILRSIRRGRPHPPLNRPLHTTRHKCCNLLNLALIQIANNIGCNETFKP